MMRNNYVQKTMQLCKALLLASVLSSAFLVFTYAEAAVLSVNPQTGVYTTGGTFTAQIRVNTQGQPINAAEGNLSFDPQKIQVLSITKGSIFTLWAVEPAFSNAAGTITFGGGSPSGYTGNAGTILSITFRAATAGNARLAFSGGSVLAADGRGTNVLSSMGSGAFTIAAAEVAPEPEVIEYIPPANTPRAPVVSSNTQTSSGDWSPETSTKLSWVVPNDVTAIRTLLDDSPSSVPTKVYETPISEITLEDLDQGISYFHLQFRNADGWGDVTHYQLAVDSEKPSSFEISLPEDVDLSNPEQTLLLTTEDATSDVTRFIVKIDDAEPYEFIDETGSSTLTLPNLDPGYHSVIIEAFDEAGNGLVSTFSFSILAFDKPQFTEYPSQINSEVIPVILGVTRPNAKVDITIKPLGASEQTSFQYEFMSDESGLFKVIPDAALQNGVYEITAVAYDKNGAQSESSEPIRIAVQDPGYIQIGSLIVSVLSVLVPLIALVVLLLLVVLFFFRKVKVIRAGVIKETDEALQVLDAEFAKLQTLLAEKTSKLEKSRKTKKLTKAETELVDELHSAITESRTNVRKEVDDVDDIVT